MAISDLLAETVGYIQEDLSAFPGDPDVRAVIEAVVIHMDRVRDLLDNVPGSPDRPRQLAALQPVTVAVEPLRKAYETDRLILGSGVDWTKMASG